MDASPPTKYYSPNSMYTSSWIEQSKCCTKPKSIFSKQTPKTEPKLESDLAPYSKPAALLIPTHTAASQLPHIPFNSSPTKLSKSGHSHFINTPTQPKTNPDWCAVVMNLTDLLKGKDSPAQQSVDKFKQNLAMVLRIKISKGQRVTSDYIITNMLRYF